MTIPAEAYYGIQTARAVRNYPISGWRAHPRLIDAYMFQEKASALANRVVEVKMAPIDAQGKLLSKAYVTVIHNGVLVQNHVELTGPTGWLGRAPYAAHPEKVPISLQDHGNPVRYRNVWVRELGTRKQEFMLPNWACPLPRVLATLQNRRKLQL